jgi:aminoglycoside phosphotransferase (APT) family kinase protein
VIDLTPENLETYLRERGWIASGPATIEVLGGGVSNWVFRVIPATGEWLVVKQSCPQLRTKDPWFSDLARIYREQEVMAWLAPNLPDGAISRLLHVDRDNYTFAMSHAPMPCHDWRSLLLAGQETAPEHGRLAGQLLGQIHQASATRRSELEPFADRTVFEQLRVDPFYVRIQERRPEVAHAVEPLIERMRSLRLGLCHGDYSPKNLLVHANGFTLVDHETAHLGDVTMDLGFFLSHLLLKAVYHAPNSRPYHELTVAFWQGYAAEVSFAPLEELLAAGIAHLGACLLARIDGTSPVPYLADERRRDAVRKLGRRLLLEAPDSWEAVLREVTAAEAMPR